MATKDSQNNEEKKTKIKAEYALFSKDVLEIKKKISEVGKNIKIRKLRKNLIG